MKHEKEFQAADRKRQLALWIGGQFTFTHFVTLASNTSDLSTAVMKDRLKHWDATVNRSINGPKWRKHWDEATWWFAFLEKPEVNPHWHLLCRVDDPCKFTAFVHAAHQKWRRIVPTGTVDVQSINGNPDRVVDYVVKHTGHELNYCEFVTPDEFRRS